ncbi:MAG: stage II sporulation protein D [Veillonellaceae bacterium]|nr:stage II sporulation protein D [Veillonellaceae bacterium]
MRRLLAATTLLVVVLVIIIPALVVRLDVVGPAQQRGAKVHKGEDMPIHVYIPELNKIVKMNLEDYIKGVVAAEMPAEFEVEALKAQAVAARTYAAKNMVALGGPGIAEHPGADVSADHRLSQAWLSETQLKAKWGPFGYDRYWAKISKAVDDTRGQILTYGGEPINAVFHSTSGEHTASAKEVWGFDYPYLQSVVCTWDKNSPRYSETKEIALSEIEQRLGADTGVMAAAQSGGSSVASIIDLTSSGRVDKIRIGSKTLTGLFVREKLELRSANFTIEHKGDKLLFKTTGYGHGVGMCQYGANGLAKEGRKYKEILTHYYTGVTLSNIFGS